jgi:hypothetical protein
MFEHMVLRFAGDAFAPATVAIAVACLVVTALGHFLGAWGLDRTWDRRLPEGVIGAALAALLLTTMLFVPETGQGFIYFQF